MLVAAVGDGLRRARRELQRVDGHVVGVRAAGLVAGDDAHAGALGDVLRGLLDDALFETNASEVRNSK
jgi:hypothetical protein